MPASPGQATASGMDVVPKLVEDDTSSVVSSMDGSTYGDYGMTGSERGMCPPSSYCTSVRCCNGD